MDRRAKVDLLAVPAHRAAARVVRALDMVTRIWKKVDWMDLVGAQGVA